MQWLLLNKQPQNFQISENLTFLISRSMGNMYVLYQPVSLFFPWFLQPFVDTHVAKAGSVLPQTYANVNLATLVLTAKLVGIALIVCMMNLTDNWHF